MFSGVVIHQICFHLVSSAIAVYIENSFVKSSEKWKAELRDGRRANVNYNSLLQALEVVSPSYEPVYFVASGKRVYSLMLKNAFFQFISKYVQ